jgi:hypothetical protein
MLRCSELVLGPHCFNKRSLYFLRSDYLLFPTTFKIIKILGQKNLKKFMRLLRPRLLSKQVSRARTNNGFVEHGPGLSSAFSSSIKWSHGSLLLSLFLNPLGHDVSLILLTAATTTTAAAGATSSTTAASTTSSTTPAATTTASTATTAGSLSAHGINTL